MPVVVGKPAEPFVTAGWAWGRAARRGEFHHHVQELLGHLLRDSVRVLGECVGVVSRPFMGFDVLFGAAQVFRLERDAGVDNRFSIGFPLFDIGWIPVRDAHFIRKKSSHGE